MSEAENTALEKTGETGMTEAQRADMLKNDAPEFLKLVHGIMIPTLKMQGIVADAGDYCLGSKPIPAGMQGRGLVVGVLADRPRATLFDGNNLLKESSTPGDAAWQEIAALAGAWHKGAKVGAEILLFVPEHDALAIFYVANKERYTVYPKLLTAMREKKFVQLTTGQKPNKHGFAVFPLVNDLREVFVSKNVLSDERAAKAIKAFESYKTAKAAPTQAPRR